MKRYAVSTNSHSGPTIEAGKRYEVSNWDYAEADKYGGQIAFFDISTTDSCGDPFTANCIAYESCAFLEGAQWTIIEEEEPSDDN